MGSVNPVLQPLKDVPTLVSVSIGTVSGSSTTTPMLARICAIGCNRPFANSDIDPTGGLKERVSSRARLISPLQWSGYQPDPRPFAAWD
jgi:hypothetical protein